MPWMLITAAIAAGGALFQLGAMSVWVLVLSLTLKVSAVVLLLILAGVLGRFTWRRLGPAAADTNQ